MTKLFISLIAAVAVFSCAKQESAPVQPERDLTVRFTTEQLSSYAFKSALEANDAVGIFASEPIEGVNVKYTATGDQKLTSATPLKWIKDNTTKVDFIAYRPYAEGATSSILDFAALADQSAEGALDASDLMAAVKDQVVPETNVSLSFSHKLSKVCVKLTNNVEGATVNGVSIEDVVLGAKVNLATGAVSDPAAKTTVKAAHVGNALDYDAIIIPQTAKPAIVVALSNGNTYKYVLSADATFTAGKVSVANLTINPVVPSEQVPVAFDFDVVDWQNGDALVTDDPIVTGEEPAVWTVIGLLNGKTTWEDPAVIEMTEDEYHNWSADITYAVGDEFKLKCGDVWAGMQTGWDYYGLGDFGNNTNYLTLEEGAANIILQAAGDYHLFFAPDTHWFVITAVEEPAPAPETVKLTLNVNNGTDWEAVYAYCWKDTDPWPTYTAAWPGDAAAAADVVVNEVTYKSFVIDGIPANATDIKFILSDGTNDNTKQTGNLTLPALAADTVLYMNLKADKTVEIVE